VGSTPFRSPSTLSFKRLADFSDEAQNIKNDSTKAAKSATALEAKYRWCLTGTPIQNTVLELYSLFRFLRIRPLDDWDLFRDRIQKPMNGGQVGLVMKRLHVILKAIMLRRTKTATIGEQPCRSEHGV
jgi:SNF2 family DNA or RNA helicase